MYKEIKMGDKLFTRLTMGGRVIMECAINTVGSMTDLLSEVRRMMGNLRGLCRLQVRNQSRGWVKESNLMFYGETSGNGANVYGTVAATNPYDSSAFGNMQSYRTSHMTFPWETH